MNADGSGLANLTNDPGSDSQPAWSPNGDKIAFTTDRDGNAEIYVMNADGSGLANLTNDPGSDTDPTFDPDGGTRIGFSTNRSGNQEVELMRSFDGSGLANVTHDGSSEFSPDWQPLPPPLPVESPIDHVVVIYQENNSFDDVLGKLCVVDARCAGATSGHLKDGNTIPLATAPDIV